MGTRTGIVRWAFVLALAAGTGGCVAAAAAGAATGVYLTTRGAESLVDAPVGQVGDRARVVFQQLEIAPAGSSLDSEGRLRELKGTKGDLDITVTLAAESDTTTKVEVTARRNLAEWDKDYARDILERIVSAS